MIKLKALNCPFCGAKPVVTPYPNGKGAAVECSSDECALWGFKADLEDWNKQRALTKRSLLKYLFDMQTVYQSAHFYKVQEFVCKGCGAANADPSRVNHKKGCEVKKILSLAK